MKRSHEVPAGMPTATMIEAAVVREPTDDEDEGGVIGKMTLVVLAPIEEARKMAGLLMYRPCAALLTKHGLLIEPLTPPPQPAPSAGPAAGAPAASPSAPSAGATPGTEDLSPSAAAGGA